MRNRAVAGRYARALLEVCLEQGVLEGVAESYAAVAAALDEHPRLRAMLSGPQIAEDDKKALLEKVFGDKVEPVLLRFFHLLIDKRRIDGLRDIAEEFHLLAEEAQGRRFAFVETAVPLPDDLAGALREKLSAVTGKRIDLETKVDPSVIGGVRVTMGDRVIDGTVRTNMARLRQRLLEADVRSG